MKNNLLSEKLVYTGDSQTPTHLHLCTYNATEIEEMTEEHFEPIAKAMDNQRINWLQVYGMKNTEAIREICTYFEIDFLILQDILTADHPTKIEEHDKYTVLILKLFHRKQSVPDEPEDLDSLEQEQLCIIQGANFMLSFMEKETGFFDDVIAALHHNVLKIRNRQTDYLLSVLLNSVMSNYISTVSEIDDALEDLEEQLLNITDEEDTGFRLQVLRRQYMLLKKAVLPLKEQYKNLLRGENVSIHKANRPYFNDVNDHLQFVLQTIDTCRETLSSLVDLYISNNNLRMNDIMKRLTVVSTIFIPLTFLVGVWGMNFRGMPELDWRYGYLYAWILIFLVGTAVYWYFRKKKWY